MSNYLKLLLLFIAATHLVCVNTQAQENMAYYQAVVPVLSQSAKDRQYAAQKGMQEVLIRMSGSESVLANEQIKRAVDKAQSYIEQFQYRLVDDEALREKGYNEALMMMFSPELIERVLLREARVSYWPPNRPDVLVWLVEDDASYGKQMLNRDMQSPITLALDKAAKERGLPLVYPLLDLDDQTAINANLLWRMDEESILAASQRYKAPVILVGRFSTTSRGEIWSTWQYFHAGNNQHWDVRSTELDQLVREALSPITSYLASLTSVLSSAEDALIVKLTEVNGFKQYRQALDYFQGLAMVANVRVLEASPGELLVELESGTTLQRFKTAVALDNKIRFLPQTSDLPEWQRPPQGTFEHPVQFSWLDR